MRAAAFLLAFALVMASGHSKCAAPFDHGVVFGEWGAFTSNWFSDDWYQYLRMSETFEGVFAYSYGGDPLVLPFRPEDVVKSDGLVTIRLRRSNDAPFRLVLSGWKARESSLLTGSLFMFRMRNGREELLNTVSVRLTLLNEGDELARRLRHLRHE